MIKTVLSIEDDDITQLLNRHNLEYDPICEKIIEAYNGEEALHLYSKLASGDSPLEDLPEVILLDLNMPIMDGWEFLEAFEKTFPEFIVKTKIFILSSSINPADIERANNEKNILAFIPKPIGPENIAVIKQLASA